MSNISLNELFVREETDNEVRICSAVDIEDLSLYTPASKNLVVFADRVRLTGLAKLPEKNVSIYCRELLSDNGVIDVSGNKPGRDYPKGAKAQPGSSPGMPGADGAEGEAGHNAGNIFILAESISGNLNLITDGGAGGRGQEGGDGATGAPGANGRNGTPSACACDDGTPGGAGGSGVTGNATAFFPSRAR